MTTPEEKAKSDIKKSNNIKSSMKKNRKRQIFTKEEDIRLLNLIKYYGKKDWKRIAALMPYRSCRQCKERYESYLSPSIKHEKFSNEEDLLLIEKYEEFGSKWKLISSFFEGRSGNQLKNRWNTYLSKLTKEQIDLIKQNMIYNQQKINLKTNEKEEIIHENHKKDDSVENIIKLCLYTERNNDDQIIDESFY